MMRPSGWKRWTFILNILLIFGLLAHSTILFVLNQELNLAEAPTPMIESIRTRIFWRKTAEVVVGACSFIYEIGHFVFACLLIGKRTEKLLGRVSVYFAVQILLLLICTVPFAMFDDPSFRGDYIFPIWGIAGVQALLLFVLTVVEIIRKRKDRGQKEFR